MNQNIRLGMVAYARKSSTGEAEDRKSPAWATQYPCLKKTNKRQTKISVMSDLGLGERRLCMLYLQGFPDKIGGYSGSCGCGGSQECCCRLSLKKKILSQCLIRMVSISVCYKPLFCVSFPELQLGRPVS